MNDRQRKAMFAKRAMKSDIIPKSIKDIISKIPVDGAVMAKWDRNASPYDETKYNISKDNTGVLEFNTFTDDSDWRTVYQWDFINKPADWDQHFDLYDLPRLGKKMHDVY